MKYFLKVGEVDVGGIAKELEDNSDLWGQFGWRKSIKDGPHSGMTDIWVRYNSPEKIGKPGFNDEHDSIWYPAYQKLPSLKEIIFTLMSLTEGERLGGVLITKIPSGCGIDPHIDKSWHVEYYDKFYVSVKSEPGAEFWCSEEHINPRPGDIWRFDNRNLHWVKNDSPGDRITLIVCIRTDKYKNVSTA